MDLKRAWRNGFLISVVFALPLSDLYNFQQSNLIAHGSSNKETIQQAPACAADTDCAGFENETGNDVVNAEENGITIPGDLLTRLVLESSGSASSNIRDAAFHFSPLGIFQSADLTDPDDIWYTTDTDISSFASPSYGFGGSASFAPGHSGPFAPAGFSTGGNSVAASGSLNALSDADETSSSNPLPESSTQTETDVPGDSETLQNVPEPSSLVLMTLGTISVAALFHIRKSKPSTTHA